MWRSPGAVYRPFLAEARARLDALLGRRDGADRALRRTQRGYAEVGASDHAARLATELGES